MEVFGRWISIMLCILQLTIMPAKILTMELNKQVEEYLISVTERFFCRVQRSGNLSLKAYEEYQEIIEKFMGSYDFDIRYAVVYYEPYPMEDPLEQEFWEEEKGLPLNIFYRTQIEQELVEQGQILFAKGDVFQIFVKAAAREEIVCICGGEVW